MLALFRLGEQSKLDRQRITRLGIAEQTPGRGDIFFCEGFTDLGR
jgi:hypothetical protein